MTLIDRIEQRLAEKGLAASAASKKAGLGPDFIRDLKRSKKHAPSGANLMALAEVLGTTAHWLMTGKAGNALYQPIIPIVGYIGAGSIVYPIDDHAQGDGLDHVEAPPGITDGIALIVRGDSMYPRYMDGDIVTFRNAETDLRDLVGKTCYVKLTDGRAFLKIIQRGSKAGLWTLNSHNAVPIEDVAVETAFPVAWVKPKE